MLRRVYDSKCTLLNTNDHDGSDNSDDSNDSDETVRPEHFRNTPGPNNSDNNANNKIIIVIIIK